MKTMNNLQAIKSLFFLAFVALALAACKKDSDDDNGNTLPVVNPLVGKYTFVAATFNDPITVIVNGDTNQYQAGDDAFLFVGGGLLGAAPCDSAAHAALELRADFTSWYICLGESNEAQQGTWSWTDDIKLLKLNIANPANFVVNITGVTLGGGKLTGTIPALPMPYDTSIPVADPLPGGGINFQTANVAVSFDVVN